MANIPDELITGLNNLLDNKYTSVNELSDYVISHLQTYNLTPTLLGRIFERIAEPDADGFSKEISITELKKIHPNFQSTNGNQWARSDISYLGRKFIIKRHIEGGQVSSVKLDGNNTDSINKYRGIPSSIRNVIRKKRCTILDIGTNIECDHKNGRYNSLSSLSNDTQKEEDYQPLSKAANDAKRQHCSECLLSGKRYDATRLGYSTPFIKGDFDTSVCVGCYWYDPHFFNEIISKDFHKIS